MDERLYSDDSRLQSGFALRRGCHPTVVAEVEMPTAKGLTAGTTQMGQRNSTGDKKSAGAEKEPKVPNVERRFL